MPRARSFKMKKMRGGGLPQYGGAPTTGFLESPAFTNPLILLLLGVLGFIVYHIYKIYYASPLPTPITPSVQQPPINVTVATEAGGDDRYSMPP